MTGRALLVLADISGYTPFMRLHRTSLAHAQDVVGRLLEAMIDAAPDLELQEVEGDALFLAARVDAGGEAAAVRGGIEAMRAMHQAFHARQRGIATLNTCRCEGCSQAGGLGIKFVAHVGEVAVQQVKHTRKLAGLDVILVHRMLKNAVPAREYLLLSDAAFRHADEHVRRRGHALVQEFDGVGVVPAHFVDLEGYSLPAPAAPEVTPLARTRENLGVVLRSLPYLLGMRRPRFAADARRAA